MKIMLTPTPNPNDYVVTFHNSQEDAENDVNAMPISLIMMELTKRRFLFDSNI